MVVRDFDAIIEVTYAIERDEWSLAPSIAEEINQIITALRVYGARRLAVPLRWTRKASQVREPRPWAGDPAHVLRTPKKREALPDVLNRAELSRLLNVPGKTDVWTRLHAGRPSYLTS